MRLSKSEKIEFVGLLKADISNYAAMAMAEYRGLSVSDMGKLRGRARQEGIRVQVLKNTMVSRAIADTPFASAENLLGGPLVFGFGKDPVALAKVWWGFAKENDKFLVRGAALGSQVLGPSEMEALSKLPPREALLAQLMGTMQAPLAQLVRTLQELPARLVRVLAAIEEQKRG